MTRLAGLILLGLLALPVEASNPTRVKKVRARPVETAEPPLAQPIPAARPAPEPMVNEKVVMAVACPQQAVARLVVNRLFGDPTYPNVRTNQLLSEAEDLRQAREEFRRFWMINQPAVVGK